jgi:hypothetical protein
MRGQDGEVHPNLRSKPGTLISRRNTSDPVQPEFPDGAFQLVRGRVRRNSSGETTVEPPASVLPREQAEAAEPPGSLATG